MTLFGLIGFTTPWLLLALLALPILWLLLRAVPPAPVRRRFPGVALLLGLSEDKQESDRTPWWLLLLRMIAVAAIVIGLAGPVLNPETNNVARSDLPLMLVMDASWASAGDWTERQQALEGILDRAAQDRRPVAVLRLTDPQEPVFLPAEVQQGRIAALRPLAWTAQAALTERAIAVLPEGAFETLWFSDGLARPERAPLLAALAARGPVAIRQGDRPLLVLRPLTIEGGVLQLTAQRLMPGPARKLTLVGQGFDPSGAPAVLVRVPLEFEAEAREAEVSVVLPAEMRARLTRFDIEGLRNAGAVLLTDESLTRREIAMYSGRASDEGLNLLSPTHYLRTAFETSADIIEGSLPRVLPANPDVVILADVARLPPAEATALADWVRAGGLLIRFAGPLTAAGDRSQDHTDPLMPVRLRAGGRSVGGAMSWGEPKSIAPFDIDGPFAGLTIPDDITVSSQVMAQPDPALAERVIAQLTDGTPLVTRKPLGEGQVVLFHVTANAEWSNLPLSALFSRMLDRLALTTPVNAREGEALAGSVWTPETVLDAFGRSDDAAILPGVPGKALVEEALSAAMPPGLYESEGRVLALNAVDQDMPFEPVRWPAGLPREGFDRPAPTPLGGWFLALALVLAVVDVLAVLALSGRLRLHGAKAMRLAPVALLALLALPPDAIAQDFAPENDDRALGATGDVVLAHVLTGNASVDDLAHAGLRGLSDTLFLRTTVEPAAPMGVDLERDELAFFPMLYWPITPDQPIPSSDAYEKLNAYLSSGGMILFDTRDADVSGFGARTAEGRKLQQIAQALSIPTIEPMPRDHVLTRTFYLLQDFPGRHVGGGLWVESAPPEEKDDGMPFRNLNDNVTPVVIGGNDWAAAWATDDTGMPLVPIGRGFSGERQREVAHRFGVNLVMHVLTGNYKSDQVHVPALLDRLGQ